MLIMMMMSKIDDGTREIERKKEGKKERYMDR